MVSEMDEQNNDSLPCHALPYCYVNIVRTVRAFFLEGGLIILNNCFWYGAPQNNADILNQTSLCVSVALSLPSTHLSLSIQPLYHTTASQVPNYL